MAGPAPEPATPEGTQSMEEDEMGIENWMPLYTADVLAGCADMSPAQFGAYMRLLCYAWQSQGLPNDMEACCRIAGGCSPADWAVVRRRLVVLDAGTSDERLSHARLESERAKQQSGYDRKVAAIAKARAARTVVNTDDSIDHSPVVNAVNKPVNQTEREPEQEPEKEPDTLKSVRRRAPRARRTPIVPLPAIGWTAADGFVGITDAHLAAWKVAYPLVDIERSKAKAHAYLLVSTKRYTGIGRFLTNWLKTDQENAELARSPAAPSKKFRHDAGREMTATEYTAWKQGEMAREYAKKHTRRTGGVASLGDVIDGQQGRRPADG